MKFRKITAAFIVCALTVSGCTAAADGTAQSEGSTASLLIYDDDTSGIELRYSSDAAGEYRIICEEQETLWELDAAPEDIRDIQIQPWGEDAAFLILTAGLQDGTENTFILNREMMSEVFIQDPYSTAEDGLDYTVDETNIFLTGVRGFYIACEDSKALTMIEHNLQVSDEVSYDTEDGTFICRVPVCIGSDNEIGRLCLYYEYDGVGMNCIDTRFVPESGTVEK